MKQAIGGLMLATTLVAGWCAVAADGPESKELTAEKRKDLEAKRKELNTAGVKHYQAGNLVQATEAFEKALDVARRLYPKRDHPNLEVSLSNLAFVRRDRGKPADAEPLFRDALDVSCQLYPKRDHADLARSQSNLAFVLQAQGKYADAEPLYSEALAMRRRLYPNQDRSDVALSLQNLAFVLNGLIKYAEAERFYREALEMRRRLYPDQEHPDVALTLNNLAFVLIDQGKHADAEPLLREALEMSRRLYPKQDHPDVALSLHNLAFVLTDEGKYSDAEVIFREALEMRRRLYSKQAHVSLALNLNELAFVLNKQGKSADAESSYREALKIYRKLYPKEDHPYLAANLNNLAFVLKDQGKDADVESLCREALEMYRRLYPKQDHPALAASVNNLASLLKDRGKYSDAEVLFLEALEMCHRLYPKQDHHYLAANLNNMAFVLHLGGKRSDAEKYYRESLKMYRAIGQAYAERRSEGESLHLASTYLGTLNLFLCNASAMKADPVAVYQEVWSVKAALTRIYERRALAARAAADDPKAAALLDNLTHRRRVRADLLLAPVPNDATTRKQRDTDLAQHAKEIENLDRALRPLLPSVDRSDKLAKATPTDLQKVLPADAAVVDFLRYTLFEQDAKKPGAQGERRTDTYLAFVITKDKVSWIDLGPAEPIEKSVTAWREAITGGKDIPQTVPQRVRDLAWAKVRKELPDKVTVVYVSPDVALCRVPWAALPGDKANTILLEDYAVVTIPHAMFLLDKLWPQDPLKNRPTSVLAVGGVSYDADLSSPKKTVVNRSDLLLKEGQKFKWDALPGAAAEVKGVTGAANKKELATATLGGDKATTAAVLAALPKARYAHLATHGFFADPSFRSAFHVDPELFQRTLRGERVGAGALSPMVMTGLVFAGANNPKTLGRGVATGEALVDLNLSGLELAVLSACETGLGDMAGGEGTFGLQRAFHLAGTRDVVASLWKVPDGATAALMGLFYRNLWENSLTPVQALRQAQLEIYHHPGRIPELAARFRGKFVVVPGSAEEEVKGDRDGKTPARVWAAFTLSGPGR